MLRALTPLFVLLVGSAMAVGCGGASGTDFDSGDASAGEPAGGGGGTGGASQGGSDQGGSGGATSGSGGSSQGGQGGSTSTGGSPTGGSPTGGSPTGGSGGTDATGGTGTGGTGLGGTSGRAGNGGQGGTDCDLAIQRAQAALNSAQVCNPLAGGMVCTGSVEDLCGCTVPVNDQNSEATKYYLELREPAVKCGVPCLAIPCLEPTTPMCGIAGGVSGIVAATTCRWGPR
jgi:hypothetical protein